MRRDLRALALGAIFAAIFGAGRAEAAPLDCASGALPVRAQAGPTPYPQDGSAWPGHGVVRVFGWMVDNRKAFWKHRDEDRCAVVFVGDSLIAGWTTLKQDFPSLKVANRGIGGDVSRGVLFRVDEDVLDLAPRAVVLLVGTNDLSAGQDPAVTVGNLEAVVQRVDQRAPGTPVIVCTLPPRDDPNAKIDPARLLDYNRRLATLSAVHRHVAVVDLYPSLALADGSPDPRYYKPDHLHLNDEGHGRLRDQLLPLLAKLDVR